MSIAEDRAQWHRHSGTSEVATAPGTTVRIQRPIPRRGLSRVEAAMYIGISPSKFDELRRDGRMGPANHRRKQRRDSASTHGNLRLGYDQRGGKIHGEG